MGNFLFGAFSGLVIATLGFVFKKKLGDLIKKGYESIVYKIKR